MKSCFRVTAVLLLCFAAALLPCQAAKMMPTLDGTLDKSQIALGKIRPGDSAEQVREICGEPQTAERAARDREVYSYKDGSFVITLVSGTVQNILCTRDGEEETPNGVTVWQDEIVLGSTYGMASQIEERADGCTVYAYWGNITAPCQYLVFTTNNGSIEQIACGVVR